MRLVLIRHAHSQSNASGVLSGRIPNVHLSDKGIVQAQQLANRLGSFPVAEIRISPMERCAETIDPWLRQYVIKSNPKVDITIDPRINEVDYGKWSGKKLSSLTRKREWATVQESPSRMYFPNGEGIAAMQSRAMETVHELANLAHSRVGVIVSHGDVIKSIVASALGMHLDEFQRIIVDPASITIIEYSGIKPRLLLLNDTRAVVTDLLLSPKRSKNLLGGGVGK
ncbi:MAG: MSMEG_4193 family putative phosphomutase [Candidatus Planktophila sp.]|nr:MSMEG_4193 family putative phosphomutase [Candidatus Planktophila sp.]